MKYSICTFLCTVFVLSLAGCPNPNPDPDGSISPGISMTGTGPEAHALVLDEAAVADGRIVVANRGAGSISVISTALNVVVGTYALPVGGLFPEPMYVVWSRKANRVFVGDRANNRVVVFRGTDFSVETTIPAGAGVFHMWMDAGESQLWVVNDIDKAVTVIDPSLLQVVQSFPMPADIVTRGGVPHDVILEPRGRFGYVTMIGAGLDSHYVVQFGTTNFTEARRAVVGRDAHLSLTPRNDYLYLPCQGSNVVTVLHRKTLSPVASIDVPAAHGAGMPRGGQTFYTTNFSGLGVDGLFAIDLATNAIIGSTNTPLPVPHNIVLTPDGEKLYVTHSGTTGNSVTVYATNGGGVPVYVTTIEVGTNPFGLAFLR